MAACIIKCNLLELSGLNTEASLDLYHKYPFSCIVAKSFDSSHKKIFVGTFGGGIVSGDCLNINIYVNSGCTLTILNQSSTKVYKSIDGKDSEYNMTVEIQNNALLMYVPEPINCFKHSRYKQIQSFNLNLESSLVFLDWIHAGRSNEKWTFTKFQSCTNVYMEGMGLILKDNWVLEDKEEIASKYATRMNPFECYATVLMIGDKTLIYQNAIKNLAKKSNLNVIWSFSGIHKIKNGLLLKAASLENECMRKFLIQLGIICAL